jgi:uncharacterized lipoprotein YmbA
MKWPSFLLLCAAAQAASCGLLQPREDPTRLFVLATIEELEPHRAPAVHNGLEVGLGPLLFPDYLRRELISRDDVTRIVPLQDERWAEPVDRAVARVLASNLAFLSGARPVAFPWYGSQAPAASVQLSFERLELEQRERAVVIATWSVRDASGNVLVEQRSRIVRDLADASGETASRELSRALAALSEEIAAAWSSAAAAPSG